MMPWTAIAQIAKMIGRELDTGVRPSEEALAAGPILAEASDWCSDFRPLRRPHRPQGRADRDAVADRPVDLSGRLRPYL